MRLFRRQLAFVFAVLAFVTSAFAAKRAEHVILISIDGGKPAVIQQSKMPTLEHLVAEGAHTWTATTTFPSITLPSHASMLTGVVPAKHHITWNSWDPAKGTVKVSTVFSEAKKAGLTTAMFVGKEKFRHFNRPGTVDKFGYNRADTVEVTRQIAGSKNPVKEDTVRATITTGAAATYIANKQPNLCFIHLADPDSIGHKFGWGSREQIALFAEVDADLGNILAAVRKAGLADQTVIIVTADHGGHDKNHGTNSEDDMLIPWIAWGRGVKKNFSITAPVSTCDTTATVLWLLDVPRPAGLDGKPVTTAFE